MTGDVSKNKKLLAMSFTKKISDIHYKFERHGVSKYFSEVLKYLTKLDSLGAKMQDWQIFASIFEHMSSQCQEYATVVSQLRTSLSKDEASVTLKTIEIAFTNAETINRIGIDNKGTPVLEPIAMNQPPAIPAARAGLDSNNRTQVQPERNGQSKQWPELTAHHKFGKPGSHKKGACLYPAHRNSDNHCYYGCSLCGGCPKYHKRQRLLNEGHKLYACDTSMDFIWQVIATEEVSVVAAEDAEDAAVGEDAVEAITRPIATPTTAAPTVLSGQAIATNAIHTVPIRLSTHAVEVVLVQGRARGHAPDGPAAIGRGLALRAIAIVREIHISKNE